MADTDRIKDILAIDIDDMIEKAEDPEEALKHLIREMDEIAAALRMEAARAISTGKRMAEKVERAAASAEDYRRRSEDAVRDGSDDLARKAIAERLDAEKALSELKPERERAESAGRTMNEGLDRLESRIDEARRKQEILAARRDVSRAPGGPGEGPADPVRQKLIEKELEEMKAGLGRS